MELANIERKVCTIPHARFIAPLGTYHETLFQLRLKTISNVFEAYTVTVLQSQISLQATSPLLASLN
jgi:hypothetical protein